ncbi:uncharacterized short protein YbdD (DUF466 family) [Luteococcus japonicus]|uniref:Uncharacterized short protein YbdD (DUF466 family) n=1 Tax=Luteococcus japonicus TaxID=33984 RepID=A0A3N1ZYR2_9ACTN|nr:YbdD/YjiX family protein [Luteococcus japonicus]ROR55969.1 uncharacterized short protein YbdD (DUF466 family) [Luteococcus japonicus]
MTVREAAHLVARVWKGMSGLDAYERYLAHHRHAHPGTPAPSRADFYRAKWDHESTSPTARCC